MDSKSFSQKYNFIFLYSWVELTIRVSKEVKFWRVETPKKFIKQQSAHAVDCSVSGGVTSTIINCLYVRVF